MAIPEDPLASALSLMPAITRDECPSFRSAVMPFGAVDRAVGTLPGWVATRDSPRALDWGGDHLGEREPSPRPGVVSEDFMCILWSTPRTKDMTRPWSSLRVRTACVCTAGDLLVNPASTNR